MALLANPVTGEVRIVDDPSGLMGEGWKQASDEQADEYAKQLDFGTLGQQAQAQGERVLRGATLGFARGIGSDEDIQARADVSQQQHPVLSFAADVAPQLALGAATGGLGEAAALGLGAARGGLAAGAAALGAESAAAGLVGAGQAAFERQQYLGDDPGRDAENALIFGGLNFGLGAVAKVIARGASEAASKASRFADVGEASIDDVAKTAESEASARLLPGVSDGRTSGAVRREADRAAVEDGLDRALSNASRSDADDLLQRALKTETAPVQEVDSLGRQRRLYQSRDAILDVATKEMQQDLTSVVAELPELARGGKVADVSRNVGENAAAQRALADGIAQNAAEFAGQLRGEAKAYAAEIGQKGLAYPVPGQKGLTLALMDNAKAISEAKPGAELFEAVDGFKRTLQAHKLSLEEGMANSLDPLAHQELVPRVATFASKVRSALEDGQVWGKAGDMQRSYNAVIHDQLLPSMRVFEESVLKRTSKGYDAVWQMEGWESKIKSLLEGKDAGKLRHVNAVLDGLDQLASVRAEFGDAAGGKSMADKIVKIRKTMGLADEVANATDNMKALGRVAGAVPLVGGMAKEWVTGDLANAFRRLTGAVDAEIDRGVDDWIASSVARGRSGSMLGKIGGFAQRTIGGSPVASLALRNGISHGLAEFMGDDATPTAAFERARASLQSDETFFQALGQDYKSMQELSPETYLMLSGQAAKLRQFLIQRMPPNVSASMSNPEGHPPTREDIEDWSVYWNAARNPTRVVRNIRGASLPELQTLEYGFPRLYERVQQRVIEKIGRARTSGQQLDDNLLMRLQVMFPDVDGVGSPAFSQQAAKLANDYTAAQQQSQGPMPRPGAPKSPTLSPIQGIAQNGATFGQG